MLVAMGSRQRLLLVLVAAALAAGLLWVLVDGAPDAGPTSLDVGEVAAETDAVGASELATDGTRSAAGTRSEATAPGAGARAAGSTDDASDDGPRASIRGRCVDAFGTGIAGVGLRLTRGSANYGGDVTDANGAFAFDDLGPGLYFVGSTADFWDALDLVPESGSDRRRLASLRVVEMRDHALTLRFVPRATLVVRVERAGGEPLPSASVELRAEAGGVGGLVHRQTDAAGEARFDGLSPGPYRVDVEVPGPDPLTTEVEVIAGRTRRIVVDADDGRGALLRGRVVDAGGEPVPGLPVAAYLFGPNARHPLPVETTAADGRFAVGRLAPGRYALVPSAARGMVATPRLVTELAPIDLADADIDVGDLVVTWDEGWALTGTVTVDPDWSAREMRDPEHASVVLELVDPNTTSDANRDWTRGTNPWIESGAESFAFGGERLPAGIDGPIWRPVLRARVHREFADPVPYEATFDVTIERGRHVHVDVTLP